MLSTRLVAGESNIEALGLYTRAAGYEKIDDFLQELRANNPRLGKAMENFLYGLADSNDLEVIIAEGNAIKQLSVPREHVLLSFVEEIVKPHFSDMSRQASIVDHLQMRNALYTGHEFHSFGEVVKKETDAALRALLSGTGDFALVGSNDVHQLFGYYLTRHGEGSLVDPHNKHNRKPKHIELTSVYDLQAHNKEVSSTRDENTSIPRLSNIFAEICTYEYLLSQGANTLKNKSLKANPQALGAMEMVNATVKTFIEKLAMDDACRHLGANDPKGYKRIGPLVEGLLADSCIQFFSELGAAHHFDPAVQDRLRMLKNAYAGENFSLPHTLYTQTITKDASQGYELFLRIYQHNLETYLKVATRETKTLLIEQLDQVKDIMKDVQINENTIMPDSEKALLHAHYRNHSLSKVAANHSTWSLRSRGIHNDEGGLNQYSI